MQMFDTIVHEGDTTAHTCRASRLYHEQSSLTPRRARLFAERVAAFNETEAEQRQQGRLRTTYLTAEQIALPRAGRLSRGPRLRDVLARRRTHRGPWRDAPMRLSDMGAMLEWSLGVTGYATSDAASQEVALRAWPSAGALYPIETYIAALRVESLDACAYHFDPVAHHLSRLPTPFNADALQDIVFAEGLWQHAAVLLVFTGVLHRTQQKYGERGYRFIHLEAGHAAQNVLLVAEAMGLAAVPLGGFCEDALAKQIGVDSEHEPPVYCILLGTKA